MQFPSLSSSSSTIFSGRHERREYQTKSSTHDVELDGLDRGEVDDLEFFGFGEAERGEVLRETLDALGGLHAGGLIVCGEVLDGLRCIGKVFAQRAAELTSTSIVRRFSETESGGSGLCGGGWPVAAAASSSSFLRR